MNEVPKQLLRELRFAFDDGRNGAFDLNRRETPLSSNALSPARRVRRTFMRFGQIASVLIFLAVAGDILVEQWIAGYATAFFIFGTACLIAAACTALFAIIATIGLVASSAFSDEPPGIRPERPEQ